MSAEEDSSPRRGPRVPYAPDDPRHAAALAALADEYTALFRHAYPPFERAIVSRFDVADPQDICGEVALWSWLHAEALTGATVEAMTDFFYHIARQVRRTAIRDTQVFSSGIRIAPAPPPSRRETAEDRLLAQVDHLRSLLAAGSGHLEGPRTRAITERCLHHLALGHGSYRAALHMIILAFLADRLWPGLRLHADARERLRAGAEVLLRWEGGTNRGLVQAVMEQMDLSKSGADKLIARVRAQVADLSTELAIADRPKVLHPGKAV